MGGTHDFYGTDPRDCAHMGGAGRVTYGAALERMRQLSDSPRGGGALAVASRADPMIRLTQQMANHPRTDSGGLLPPLRGSPRDQARKSRGPSPPPAHARTGGLYCPGEGSAVQQSCNLRDSGVDGRSREPVWLPIWRGPAGRAGEPRHTGAGRHVELSGGPWGSATCHGGPAVTWNGAATARRFTAAAEDYRPNDTLTRLQCVTSPSPRPLSSPSPGGCHSWPPPPHELTVVALATGTAWPPPTHSCADASRSPRGCSPATTRQGGEQKFAPGVIAVGGLAL